MPIFGYDVPTDRSTVFNYEASLESPTAFGKFTGKERDAESGLDYFGARYYRSALGRFTSPDEFKGGFDNLDGTAAFAPGPIDYADLTDPQTLNKYAYVRNNPFRYVDPDGHQQAVVAPTAEELIVDTLVAGAELPLLPVVILLGATAQPTSTQDVLILPGKPTSPAPVTPGQPSPTPPVTGPADPKLPSTENAEHTKGARRSTKDKHESTRSGYKKPPNYVPDREFEKPKEKKSNQPVPPKVHKNKYKKETQDGNS